MNSINSIQEEVQQIVDESEKRMDARIEMSHGGIAKTISHIGAEILEIKTTLQEHTDKEGVYQKKVSETLNNLAHLSKDDITALKDIAQGYAGMDAMRKMILGLASIIIAIGAIVAGFIGIVKAIR